MFSAMVEIPADIGDSLEPHHHHQRQHQQLQQQSNSVTISLDIPLRVVFQVPDGCQLDNCGATWNPTMRTDSGVESGTSAVTRRKRDRPKTANGRCHNPLNGKSSSAGNGDCSGTVQQNGLPRRSTVRPKTATAAAAGTRHWTTECVKANRLDVTSSVQNGHSNTANVVESVCDESANGEVVLSDSVKDDLVTCEASNSGESRDEFNNKCIDHVSQVTTTIYSYPSIIVETVPTQSYCSTWSSTNCDFTNTTSGVGEADCIDNDDGVDLAMSSSGEDVFDGEDYDDDSCCLEPSGVGSAMDAVRSLVCRLGLHVTSSRDGGCGGRFPLKTIVECNTSPAVTHNAIEETLPSTSDGKFTGVLDDLRQLRATDESLARTFLSLCARLQQYKLQRHCLRHQDVLCDVMDTHDERCHRVTHLLPYVDMTPAVVQYSAPLRQYRLARADLNEVGERRFSVL